MYPFQSRARWLVANRYLHLIEALERQFGADKVEAHPILGSRVRSIRNLLRVRSAVFLLLYMHLIAASASVLLRRIPESEAAISALNSIAALTSALAFVLAAAILLLGRFLGQHEIDILAYLALGPKKRAKE